MKHFGYCKDDIILCEVTGAQAVDLHHIVLKSQGGTDEVDNIIALSREQHELAHAGKLSEEYLQKIHNYNL